MSNVDKSVTPAPPAQSTRDLLPVDAVFKSGTEVLTSSRTVAAVFGKEHKNVLRDIDVLLAHGSDLSGGPAAWFHFIDLPHPTVAGRIDRSYTLTRDGFTLLAMGFTGKAALQFKLLYIEAFNRIEAALRASVPGPVNLDDPRALRAVLIAYTDKVVALQGQVEHLQPKAAALDLLGGKVGSTNITDTAKAIRLSPRYLFTWLGEHAWTYRRRDGASWKAFQDKIDAGLLEHVELPDRQRADRSFPMCMVTPKGRTKLAEIFSRDLGSEGRKP